MKGWSRNRDVAKCPVPIPDLFSPRNPTDRSRWPQFGSPYDSRRASVPENSIVITDDTHARAKIL
jgi:hypothetical protein